MTTTTPQAARAPANGGPKDSDSAKIRADLTNGRTVGWCAATYSWPREQVTRLINNTPGWLYSSDTDKVRVFQRTDKSSDHGEPAGNLEDLLRRGEKSESAATRQAATRARTAVEKLRQRLAAEQAEQQVRGRITDLRKQLAAAEEQLRDVKNGRSSTPSKAGNQRGSTLPPGVTAKEVRDWATTNNVECSPNGRVPVAVVQQYLAARGLNGA